MLTIAKDIGERARKVNFLFVIAREPIKLHTCEWDNYCVSHLSKGTSDLKQKCTQLLAPFLAHIFMLFLVTHFVRSISLRNRFLNGLKFFWWKSRKTVPGNSIGIFVQFLFEATCAFGKIWRNQDLFLPIIVKYCRYDFTSNISRSANVISQGVAGVVPVQCWQIVNKREGG